MIRNERVNDDKWGAQSKEKDTKIHVAKKIPTTVALLMIQAHIHFTYFFDI